MFSMVLWRFCCCFESAFDICAFVAVCPGELLSEYMVSPAFVSFSVLPTLMQCLRDLYFCLRFAYGLIFAYAVLTPGIFAFFPRDELTRDHINRVLWYKDCLRTRLRNMFFIKTLTRAYATGGFAYARARYEHT